MSTEIQKSVVEKIAGAGPSVKETVIAKLADVEITKRVDTITKAVQKLETLEKEYKKINKADNVTYVTTEGADTQRKESMTEARYKEIGKAKLTIDNLEKAINSALEKNDADAYNKLNGLLGGGGNKEKSSGDGEQE